MVFGLRQMRERSSKRKVVDMNTHAMFSSGSFPHAISCAMVRDNKPALCHVACIRQPYGCTPPLAFLWRGYRTNRINNAAQGINYWEESTTTKRPVEVSSLSSPPVVVRVSAEQV